MSRLVSRGAQKQQICYLAELCTLDVKSLQTSHACLYTTMRRRSPTMPQLRFPGIFSTPFTVKHRHISKPSTQREDWPAEGERTSLPALSHTTGYNRHRHRTHGRLPRDLVYRLAKVPGITKVGQIRIYRESTATRG